MANIAISDLRPVGANLFQDTESFLHELTEAEIGSINGGIIVADDVIIVACLYNSRVIL